ncbi:DNA topoisomerase VI subunit B [Candidatus Nitrosocosmicus hydrocola]|uniref:DNA topoisomerase VI subunit B n=1 Tax=Candidatus Nitrosocosmicus hydrocola TaxID=1826872 RepID=UPI000A8FF976|nr:DNA topoisomerase VI subunit B [Candidatus Nitrosocosmicus hydrocola]
MPTKSSAATTTTTTTATTPTTTTLDNAVLDSSKDKSLKKNEENTQSSKLEKYTIVYNKKAESEFFVDNSALAGFTGERILYMAIRELIENSLDSCESFSILPSINVSLKIYDQANDLWTLSCEDNGTGINSEKLPVAVCSFLTSAKYMEKQQRGLFGVGLKMVAAFSTKDTDFPIKVWNHSIDESDEYYFELRTDIGTNKPIVLSKKLLKNVDAHSTTTTTTKSTSGFKIEVILRAKLMPITKSKIYEYVSETSIVNPYASITFETDDGMFHFDRRTSIMPQPAQEILPHPSDMDLKTLKKAISKFQTQKMSLPKILSSSFQKLSYEKARDIVTNAGLSLKTATGDFSEHDLIKVVNICKKTRFQNPNTDHLSPIGENVLTIGMMSEYTIVSSKGSSNDALSTDKFDYQNSAINKLESDNSAAVATAANTIDDTTGTATASADALVDTVASTTPIITAADDKVTTLSNTQSLQQQQEQQQRLVQPENSSIISTTKNNASKTNFSVKVLKPVLTTYTSRTCVINNRPTIVETGLAYGGDIPSFKMYRFANKIPLLYDEGSDVAREVISEVEINKMGITKKQAKEQFSTNKESKKDRVIEVLPLHIFFHICSTKIPYKTAGKESIASEGELKYYMKSCLSELYRKLSTQIRKELKLKEAENKLRLYKHYLPFIVESINESLGIKNSKLNDSFSRLIENHLSKKPVVDENEISATSITPSVTDTTTTPSVSQTNTLNTSSSSSITSTTPNKSPGSANSTSIKSIPSSLQSRSLPRIDNQQSDKINEKQKPKKQEIESSISKSGPDKNNNNNNNQVKKKTNKSISKSAKSKTSNNNNNFTRNRKLDIKEAKKSKKTIMEKKSKIPTPRTTPTTTISKNKKYNRSDILKKDINKIKVQKKSSNKMSKKPRGGGKASTVDATKIPSSHPSQTRQIQSTMDSFSKRVNKGKRK